MDYSEAPLHVSWRDIPPVQLNPLLSRQFVSGRHITFARLRLKKNCHVPIHSHPSEQVSSVLSGVLEFTLDPGAPGERRIALRPGEVLVIPPFLPHSALALEDTENLDIFSPPREDWISGADAYLR